MKKIIFLLLICFTLTGCVSGNKVPTDKTEYSVILNSGSSYVFTFKDPSTNVWYISNINGVTPRLNQDGTLYVK